MSLENHNFEGTIHGRTVELSSDPCLPEGQRVVVALRIEPRAATEDGLKQAFGSWQEMPDFDAWLAETYAARESDTRDGE